MIKCYSIINIKNVKLNMNEYKLIKTEKLEFSHMRDVRLQIVDQIKNNIKKNGFYEARVLSVVSKGNGKYVVGDGNHRLQALLDLDLEDVPCIVYDDKDVYKLAVEGNQAENTYAPMDLFDWLSIIGRLKGDGLTQKEIAGKIGWNTKQQVSFYNQLLEKLSTQILDFCKQYQNGRVDKKSTNVDFDFTEGWFRNSGLYDLKEAYQLKCLERFVDDKCRWSKQKLQIETVKYKQWQEFTKTCKDKLVDAENLEQMIDLIENNTFKTEKQLLLKIGDYNKESKNKLICGDALQELEELDDSMIDIVISDPPYGQNYVSWRSAYKDHIGHKGVQNDDDYAFELLDKSCQILQSKTKPDAHIYFCCSWKVECEFRKIINKYFEVKNIIIWDKGNHGAGDLKGNWADRYEMIIFAIKGDRNMVKRKANIIMVPRIASSKLRHPTEKPVQLIKELLSASARPNDTICDPFMGAGSTIKACVDFGDLNYIGIELDREIFEKAKSFIGE